MKTPEQIADETMEAFTIIDAEPELDILGDVEECSVSYISEQIAAAIRADRAQRNLIECIAEALDDRGAEDAAQLVRDTDPDDDLWNNYVGPMLDSIEDDYTRMARESQD